MPIYLIVGPAAAVIGIVAILFVMRHRSVQERSMYSSRRSQIERKVRSARARTLAPRGRGDRPPSAAEIAAAAPPAQTYQPPSSPAPRQAWEASPAQAYAAPAAPSPDYTAPAPDYPAPSTPAPSEGEWTPSPAEESWTPAPAPAAPAAPAEVTTSSAGAPAGGGASWEVVGGGKIEEEAPAAQAKGKKDKDKGKDKGRDKPQETGGAWQLASGNAPTEGEEAAEEPKKPSAAMALAQYAVLVVGLVMVLIGVLVMVANSKVT